MEKTIKLELIKISNECSITADIMNDFFLKSTVDTISDQFHCNSKLFHNGDEFNFAACTLNDVYVSVNATQLLHNYPKLSKFGSAVE